MQFMMCRLQHLRYTVTYHLESMHLSIYLSTYLSLLLACDALQVCALQLQHLFTTFRSCNSPAMQLDLLQDASVLMSFQDGCVRMCDPATRQDTLVTLPQLSTRSPRCVRSVNQASTCFVGCWRQLCCLHGDVAWCMCKCCTRTMCLHLTHAPEVQLGITVQGSSM